MKPFLEKNVYEKRKKGQAEIFGLIIIVILLIFAFLFFVKTRQDDSSTMTIRSNFRANNLLNAIVNLDADVGADRVAMKEMLKTCLSDGNCDSETIILGEIFKETLMESEKYEFEATGPRYGFVLPDPSDCTEGITASPIRLPGSYVFRLKLCST